MRQPDFRAGGAACKSALGTIAIGLSIAAKEHRRGIAEGDGEAAAPLGFFHVPTAAWPRGPLVRVVRVRACGVGGEQPVRNLCNALQLLFIDRGRGGHLPIRRFSGVLRAWDVSLEKCDPLWRVGDVEDAARVRQC